MPNYANGKIYCIRSPQTDKIYIGSTTVALSQRMSEHRSEHRLGKKNCSSKHIVCHKDAYIELLEEFPCDNKEQLNAREGYYQRLHKEQLINQCIAGRTHSETNKEWRARNKEKITIYEREYKAKKREAKTIPPKTDRHDLSSRNASFD